MDDANIIEYYLWSVEYLVCNNLSFSREQVVTSLSWVLFSASVFCQIQNSNATRTNAGGRLALAPGSGWFKKFPGGFSSHY